MQKTNIEKLKALKPGDKFLVKGYKQGYEADKEQEGEDLVFTLLPADGYENAVRGDLALLRSMEPSEVDGEFSLADITAALVGLIESREKTLERYEAERANKDSEKPKRGPQYENVGGQLHTLGESYYMIGLTSDSPKKTKKKSGSIPRAKEYLSKILDLPTAYYWFALKLDAERFKEIELT